MEVGKRFVGVHSAYTGGGKHRGSESDLFF